jgi:predicted nucleic acid-binding protein
VTRIAYLDASAIVKLVVDEDETAALRGRINEPLGAVTSIVGLIETRRAASRRPHDGARLTAVLDRIEVIALGPTIALSAAMLAPPSLRTLDAIHLATALELGSELVSFLTYDGRLAEAARALGLTVASPA